MTFTATQDRQGKVEVLIYATRQSAENALSLAKLQELTDGRAEYVRVAAGYVLPGEMHIAQTQGSVGLARHLAAKMREHWAPRAVAR